MAQWTHSLILLFNSPHLLKLFESWTLSRRIHCYVPKTGFTTYMQMKKDHISGSSYSLCVLTVPACVCTNQTAAVHTVPDGCEAEVCMSHMDPVSGTDIDLFIEGIILCSLHLGHKATPDVYVYFETKHVLQSSN